MNTAAEDAARGDRRALVVQTGFIGDVVLATALFAPLKQAGYEVWAMVKPSAAPIVRNNPALSGVLTDDKRRSRSGPSGLLAATGEIKRMGFDLALSPHRSHRTSLMLWLARIPRRVGFDSSPLRFLFTNTAAPAASDHQLERNARLLGVVGIEPSAPPTPCLRMPHPASERAASLLSGLVRPIIGVAPGSAWATKRWPPEKFAAALRTIAQRCQSPSFVLLGDDNEREAAARIAWDYKHPVLDLTGRTSLELLCAIVEHLDLLICNDSAPIHIAGAYRVPTVAIFLATHPRFGFGPFAQPYRIAQTELGCRPCSPHGTRQCPLGHFNCAHDLPPAAVAQYAFELLTEKSAC